MKTFSNGVSFVAVIGGLALVLLAGCATDGKPAAKKTYTFFPPPPEEPRIQFLTSFSSDVDLGRARTFADFIIGEQTIAGALVKPYGLALHGGKIFVCETIGGVIEIFDLNKNRASYFSPTDEGKLRMPINITIDGDGTRYVADTGRRQVLIFREDGSFLSAIGQKDEIKPTDVAVSNDRLYIGDLQNHAVRVYNKADQKFLFSIPRGTNASDGKLFSPANLALDKNGRLLVSDMGSFSVQVFDLEGKYLNTIGRQGVGMGKFARPKGVAVDREGIAYVVDAATQVVQVFDSAGQLLLFFGEPGTSSRGQLVLPASVKVDYDHVSYFQKYVVPGYQCEYLILVTSQFGDNKVNVYGFLKKK